MLLRVSYAIWYRLCYIAYVIWFILLRLFDPSGHRMQVTVTLWPHLENSPVHQQKTYQHSESGSFDIWNQMSRISLFNAFWNRFSDLVSWLAQQGRNHETIYFCAFRGFCQLRKNSRENNLFWIRDRSNSKAAISIQSSRRKIWQFESVF